jgi:hypothetical protein
MVENASGVDRPRKEKVLTHKVSVPSESMPIAKDADLAGKFSEIFIRSAEMQHMRLY